MICDSQTVEATLLEYAQTQRDPSFNSALVLSEWYDLFPANESHLRKPLQWPQTYPNAVKPGIYLIFDASESLLYVGKSERSLESRLVDYFGYESGHSGPCKIKDITPTWKTRPRYLRTLAVTKSWEAPSLERFLIRMLQPPENTHGISRVKSI